MTPDDDGDGDDDMQSMVDLSKRLMQRDSAFFAAHSHSQSHALWAPSKRQLSKASKQSSNLNELVTAGSSAGKASAICESGRGRLHRLALPCWSARRQHITEYNGFHAKQAPTNRQSANAFHSLSSRHKIRFSYFLSNCAGLARKDECLYDVR